MRVCARVCCFLVVAKIIPNWYFVLFFQSRYSPHPAFILQAVTMPTGVIIIIATMRNVKNKSKPKKNLIFKQNKNRMESRYYAGLATSTLSYWLKVFI
jgi:hypothetical protein